MPLPHESFQCTLSTDLDARLAQRAVIEQKTKSEIIAAALEAYLAPETPLERSLKAMEQTLGDRLLGVESRLGRMESRLSAGAGLQIIPAPISLADPLHSWVQPPVDPDEDCDDEPDEILTEFAEFATPCP